VFKELSQTQPMPVVIPDRGRVEKGQFEYSLPGGDFVIVEVGKSKRI